MERLHGYVLPFGTDADEDIVDGAGEMIASMWKPFSFDGIPYDKIPLSNLFAAAPELAAALKELLEEAVRQGAEETRPVVIKARAALQKAGIA